MKLKAIGRVSVSDLSFKIGGQVDDMNCTEWALLWAYTTTDAQALGDIGNLRFGSDFNTKLSCPHNRATSLAFLSAFLWLALFV